MTRLDEIQASHPIIARAQPSDELSKDLAFALIHEHDNDPAWDSWIAALRAETERRRA